MATPKTLPVELRTRIDSFVDEIHSVVRIAALEELHATLAAQLGGAPRAIAPKRAAGRTPRLTKRKVGGGKRTPEAVMETASTVLEYVKKNPGQRIEEIAKGLGVPSGELKLPVQKLLSSKGLATKGQKRGTRYFAR